MSKRLIATVSAVLAIAASLPVGAAKALPAQNGGGCNMVWHLSQPGGDNMMAGSAHGTGQGAANMFDLLASFSDDHCGLGA